MCNLDDFMLYLSTKTQVYSFNFPIRTIRNEMPEGKNGWTFLIKILIDLDNLVTSKLYYKT